MIEAHLGGDRRIGRYRLIKRLAPGGMSDLYLAQLHGPRGYERTLVIKTLRPDLLDDVSSPDILIREARIASRLRHDNIIEVIEIGEDRGVPFLAMEFVFGRDLRQIQERCRELGRTVPFQHTVTILADVLDALAYAHHATDGRGRLDVIHRDVSPQNVVVGFDGGVKLLDFGLAKANADVSKTHAGILKGKYAYMSPEQVDLRTVDHRTDIFSTGIVLWELLTGQRLFLASNEVDTVRAVARCRVPFARAVRVDVPWNLAWVALWSLRRQRWWRYGSAWSMRDALLLWDARGRDEARDALADWMAELFAEQLSWRDAALTRTRIDPPRFRQIRDAGFELLEEPTEPDSLRVPPQLLMNEMSTEAVPGSAATAASHAPTWMGVGAAILSNRRVFVALLVAAVLGCAALGVFFGYRGGRMESYGYLYVFADSIDVEVTIGEREVGKAPVQRVAVRPGQHVITGRSVLGSATVEVTVAPGQNRVVQLRFPVEQP